MTITTRKAARAAAAGARPGRVLRRLARRSAPDQSPQPVTFTTATLPAATGPRPAPGAPEPESEGPSAAVVEDRVVLADLAQPARGASNRPKPGRAKHDWYFPRAEPSLTTTRQGEVLNLALLAAPTDEAGIPIGRDGLTQSPVTHDPFTAYQRKVITSPHVVVLGVIGAGKSSLIKTVYVLRPLALRRRRAFIMDRKDRGGEGEYSELCRRFGTEPYRFVIGGGGTRLNPLDPRIQDVIGADGQLRLISALASHSIGRSLDVRERHLMRAAYRHALRVAEQEQRHPVLGDLVPQLGTMPVLLGVDRDQLAYEEQQVHGRGYREATLDQLEMSAINVQFALEEVLSEELNGLFDGETSSQLQLGSRMTSFDISQLPVEGPSSTMVMAVGHAYLMGTLRRERGLATNFIVEEGWDVLNGPIAKQFNASQMLARGLGLCTVASLQHVAQAAKDSEAASLLREPQTIHLYRQDRDEDLAECVRMYGLNAQSEATMRDLGQGQHLMKIGNRTEILVDHVRSSLEAQLTDTDSAMIANTIEEAA